MTPLALVLWCLTPRTEAVVLAKVDVTGDSSLPRSVVLKALPWAIGSRLEPETAPLVEEAVASLYRGEGFLESRTTATWRFYASSATLSLSVAEGPRWTFGRTSIEGLRAVPEKAVLLELPYRPGGPYRRPELFLAQSRLYALDLFEDVSISVSTTPARAADVAIKVVERPAKRLRAGLGWGSQERERLSIGLTHDNLFHRAYRADIDALYSHVWMELKARFLNRHLWDSRVQQDAQASWRRELQRGYELEKTAGRAGLARELPLHAKVSLQYSLERDAIYRADPELVAGIPSTPATSDMAAGLERDTTNDPFFPDAGSRASLRADRAGGFLGGDVDLNRMRAAASAYQRVGPIVTAETAEGGIVRSFHPSAEVPVFQRFFAGGGNSVRGWRERDVGPKDALGSPLGGEVLLRASVELRFPLWRRLAGAAFVDGGQVDSRASSVAPSFWKYGAGPGLRLRTPVGPLRLDLGYKLNPDPGDRSRWTVHLSLGEAF